MGQTSLSKNRRGFCELSERRLLQPRPKTGQVNDSDRHAAPCINRKNLGISYVQQHPRTVENVGKHNTDSIWLKNRQCLGELSFRSRDLPDRSAFRGIQFPVGRCKDSLLHHAHGGAQRRKQCR